MTSDDSTPAAFDLLVQASRVSPPLREAVQAVEDEVHRLRRAIDDWAEADSGSFTERQNARERLHAARLWIEEEDR